MRPRIGARPVKKNHGTRQKFTGWEVDPSSPPIRNEIFRDENFHAVVFASHPLVAIAPPPPTPAHLSRPFFTAMKAFQLSPVIVDGAHAQSPPTDLVVGNVAPVIAQGTIAPVRKRQGNVIMQDGNSAGPVGKARSPAVAVGRHWRRRARFQA